MKKLRLLAMSADRQALLKELLLLGCVEVSEPTELPEEAYPALSRCDSAELTRVKAQHAELTNAVKLLDKYSPEKSGFLKPLPEAEAAELLDEARLPEDIALAQKLMELEERIRRNGAEVLREQTQLETLAPWLPLDLPLSCKGTERAAAMTASLPAALDMTEADAALGAAAPEAQLFRVSDDKSLHYVLLVCLRDGLDAALEALRPLGFNLMSPGEFDCTAKQAAERSEKKIADLNRENGELAKAIAAEAPHRSELKLRADTLATKITRAEAEARLMQTETSVCLQGWVPAEKEQELAGVLAKYDCAWETADPAEDEYPDVPVKLKNNRFTRAMNMVTEMYSLPAYDGVDPNPLMAPFFILFYGIMLADMGYGVLMIIIALLVLGKKKPKRGMRNFFELLLWCGISTTVWGVITGGCFGDLPLQVAQIINPDTTWTGLPALFTPLEDTVMILIGAMVLGVVQIITGMVISFVEKCKAGDVFGAVFEEGTWWMIFAGGALAALGIGSVAGVPVVLVIGIVMLVIGNAKGKKNIASILIGVVAAVYNGVTGYFGDILSYSRLMALMLAGSVIAQVFNTIGAIFGNIVVFLIISIVGNALNFALNLLGCFVHDLRLQCLEYFGKFYKDGGRPFRPLEINTKFVNVATTDK